MKIYFTRVVFSNNYVLNNGVADTEIEKKLINLYSVHEAFLTFMLKLIRIINPSTFDT